MELRVEFLQCGCGSSFAHIEVPRRVAQTSGFILLVATPCTFVCKRVEIYKENAVFENAQIEVLGCGGISGGSAPSTPGPPEGMNVVSHA